MTMDCREAEELLGAYALDALEAEEARRMEEHLASCSEHAMAAAELRQTRSLLALTVEDAAPSDELRDRILQAVKTDPSAESSTFPARERVRVPIRRAPLPRWGPRPAFLAAAAALLLALGIGGVIGYQLSQSQQLAYTFVGDPSRAPGAEARLVYLKDRKQAVLSVTGLPRLAAGQVYELWLIRGGQAVDEGVSAQANGRLGLQVAVDLTQYDELAITIEQGEQPQPTSTPILAGHLRG